MILPVLNHPEPRSKAVPALSPYSTCKVRQLAAPIPLSLWKSHRDSPDYLNTLPDGTPLKLTSVGVDFLERITGSLLWPRDTFEASALLWAATLTEEDEENLWTPAPPIDDEDAAPAPLQGMNAPHLAKLARSWARSVIPPGAAVLAQNLARALWCRENDVILEIDTDAMPESDDSDEKKNPVPVPTGSSPASMPFPEATPFTGPPSSGSPIAPSSPPTAHGSPPTASPLSPPPAEPPASNSSQTSSLVPWPADKYFWVGENRFTVPQGTLYFAYGQPPTEDIHFAAKFATPDECREALSRGRALQNFQPREHIYQDAPK